MNFICKEGNIVCYPQQNRGVVTKGGKNMPSLLCISFPKCLYYLWIVEIWMVIGVFHLLFKKIFVYSFIVNMLLLQSPIQKYNS